MTKCKQTPAPRDTGNGASNYQFCNTRTDWLLTRRVDMKFF